jgi:hypothetical protein
MDLSKLKYITTDAPTTDELELLNESRSGSARSSRARLDHPRILAAYGILPLVHLQHYSIDPQQALSTAPVRLPSSPGASWRSYNAVLPLLPRLVRANIPPP